MSYSALGKEVLCNDRHFADAIDADAARLIADALNDRTFDPDDGRETIETPTYSPHHVRQENDEFACSCGRRWDVSEGEAHP